MLATHSDRAPVFRRGSSFDEGQRPSHNGIDLAREVKIRWPLLPMILTSGHPREHVGKLPPGVAYMPKPWQPLNVLIAAEQALASA
jgi:hypothetical protein